MAPRKDPYISVTETARRLRLAGLPSSRSTVEKRVAEGELSATTVAGRLVVLTASVDRYLARQRDDNGQTAAA